MIPNAPRDAAVSGVDLGKNVFREKLDLPLAVEIADLAKVVGTDDIDIDR